MPRPYPYLSMFFDRVSRVHKQIHEDLVQLPRVAYCQRDISIFLDERRLVFELVPYYVDGTFETRVDVRRFKLRFIYAGEILKVLDYLLDSVGTLKGFLNQVIEVFDNVIYL